MTFTGINRLGENILVVGDNASKFEATIGEVTTGIATIGNKAGLDMRGEWGPPQERRGAVDKPHSNHARFGGINGTNGARGKVGNNFSQPGGAKVEVGSEGFEIIELGTDMGIDAHTVPIGMEDAGLKGAEKATTTRDSQHHAAEFTHQDVARF
jgi:hypothetical protein